MNRRSFLKQVRLWIGATSLAGSGLWLPQTALTQDGPGTLKWNFETGGAVNQSAALGADGTIYFGSFDKHLYAVRTDSMGLADSAWPMIKHDAHHSGRSGGP